MFNLVEASLVVSLLLAVDISPVSSTAVYERRLFSFSGRLTLEDVESLRSLTVVPATRGSSLVVPEKFSAEARRFEMLLSVVKDEMLSVIPAVSSTSLDGIVCTA